MNKISQYIGIVLSKWNKKLILIYSIEELVDYIKQYQLLI